MAGTNKPAHLQSFAGPITAEDIARALGFMPSSGGPSGSGTVTNVSVATANGFSGTVADPTGSAAITMKTSITGMLKGNGTAISAATAGVDYQVPLGSVTKSPTGFTEPENVVVTYDSATRKITLTGTVVAYWQGTQVTALTSGWVSAAHDNTNGTWFLLYDGANFVWQNTSWTFDQLMIAYVNFGVTNKFAIRECHGLMDWMAHEEFHRTNGTYLQSGGDVSGYTAGSTTVAERRPAVSAAVVHDEDIETTIPLLADGGPYTQLTLTSTGTSTFTTAAAEIVPVSGAQPYYNSYSAPNWGQTLLPNNSYMTVWLVAVPATADATSQAYRYLWLQGQSEGTLASQQATSFGQMNLGQLATLFTEFVPIAKVILRYTASDWTITSIEKITGTKVSQSISTAGFLTAVTATAPITGTGTALDPLVMAAATSGTNGYLTSANWTTFNGKQNAYTILTTFGGLANASGYLQNNGAGVLSWGTPSASATWGSITGTLSAQTDLDSALSGKQAAYTILSTLGALANASGYLTNNGSGTLSWSAGSGSTGAVTITLNGQTNMTLASYYINAVGSANTFYQSNFQNKSNGAAASTDVVCTTDTGTDSTEYIDMGINGSGFSGSWGSAKDGYLYVDGGASGVGDLVMGTAQPSTYASLQVGSGAAAIVNGFKAEQTQQQHFNTSLQHFTWGMIFAQTATKTHGNSASEVTLASTGRGTLTLTANYLIAGRVLRIRAGGYLTTLATAPGNFTLKLYLGATAVLSTTANAMVVNTTTRRWEMDATIVCYTNGASGTVWGEGRFETSNNSEVTAFCYAMKKTATSTIDTTGTLAIDLKATWATANASNSITCTYLTVEGA